MEQGYKQFFRSLLKDFEYYISSCREAYTKLGKSIQLKASLKINLWEALVGLKLPAMENYSAYIEGIAEVAVDLEVLGD